MGSGTRRGGSRAIACLAVASIVACGCSTTATIHRLNGPDYEATIVDSDASALRLRGGDQRTYAVKRGEVFDIDHPGNVVMTVGAIFLGLGTFVVAGTYGKFVEPMAGQTQGDAATGAALTLILPGLILATMGAIPYFTSRRNARAFESAPPVPTVASPIGTFRPQQPPPITQ
jgi:hypothetical protein